MGPGEQAVLQAAVARGYISHQQVEEARKIATQLGTAGGVLAVLSERYLSPAQREEMRKVWRDASGQESTRADEMTVPPPGMMDATLPPPGSPVPGEEQFDSRGDTLSPQRGATDLGTLSPAPAVFLPEPGSEEGLPSYSEVDQPEEPAAPLLSPSGRYDPTAATILEPEGPIAPPLPAHDDFRSAHTLIEGPGGQNLRDMHTVVEERTIEQVSKGPEQTEVARRGGMGQTRPDEPHSRQNLSGVEPSLLSRGGGGAAKAPPRKVGPERIGKFKVVRELGRGGMGVVYEAKDEYLDRPVALKVLIGGLSASDQAVQRFKIEGLAAERLKHENVVQVIELGQDPNEGNWYMAMELIRGISLKEKIEKNGPLDEATSIRYTKQLAKALGFAHEQNVLHRDVKPHNVLLDPQDVPKLTDFGLAKLVGDHQHSLTATGPSVMGTPGFMPPEQAGASTTPPDGRADVYSLGATLFYMLTGRAPFQDDSVARVLMAVVKNPPPLPSTLRPGLSHDLETIILKCLEKKPDDRYADMAALEEDLQRFIDARQIVAKRPGVFLRLSRWAAANQASAIGLSLATVLCSGLIAREIMRETPPPIVIPPNGNGKGIGPLDTRTTVPPPPVWEWQGPPFTPPEAEWRDTRFPILKPVLPEPEAVVGVRELMVRVEASDDSGKVVVKLGKEQELDLSKDPTLPSGTYEGFWVLEERHGEHVTTVSAVDTSNNTTEIEVKVTLDLINPTLEVLEPVQEEITEEVALVKVKASEPVRLEADWGDSNINRDQYDVQHVFQVPLTLDREVTLKIVGRDRAGRKAEVTRRLKRILHPWLRGDGARWQPCPAQLAIATKDLPVKADLAGRFEMLFVLLPPGQQERKFGVAKTTRPSYVSATEVTNRQFRLVFPGFEPLAGFDHPDQPALVSWSEAQSFCAELTKLEPRLGPQRVQYQLPSELEWEIAAAGATPSEWWRDKKLFIHGSNTGATKPTATLKVATLAANPLGLYDVYGNADEWCRDYFASTYPEGLADPVRDQPVGPGFRVVRGGSWADAMERRIPGAKEPRASAKDERSKYTGFRIVARLATE